MYTFKFFTTEDEKNWDNFIKQQSINGTFLQSRNFLNYHGTEKFKDVSLLVYNEKGNIAGLVPACEREQDGKKVFFSHLGSTFGGLIVDKKHHCAKHLVPMVEELKEFLKEEGYNRVILKQTSDIFSKENTSLFQYVFWHAGFTEYKELSTYVDYAQYKDEIISNLAQGKRTNVHNCEKQGLELRELTEDEQIGKFYDILCENLQKYDTKPVHTLEELLEFKNERLVDSCGFYGIFHEDEMLAGGMMFYFPEVSCAHTQYLAARQEFNKLSPMSYMYYALIVEMKKRGYQKLSWGTVTEERGAFLNMGLITSKEDYGSKHCNNYTYIIEL